jgi:hypothetical protein
MFDSRDVDLGIPGYRGGISEVSPTYALRYPKEGYPYIPPQGALGVWYLSARTSEANFSLDSVAYAAIREIIGIVAVEKPERGVR